MSLLSSLIVTHAVKALESQFVSYSPELQQAFLNEVSSLVNVVSDWMESKMTIKGELSNEEKIS